MVPAGFGWGKESRWVFYRGAKTLARCIYPRPIAALNLTSIACHGVGGGPRADEGEKLW